ncbi:protein suppressor of hairy wing-like isoform X2 [Leptopilina boulardi]|uniref:protein suppressor of hairy wing-like isoform X2 n=1 Tax=Leptopilina boulardi TaxID=63433 RepID=UPI0021F698EF|nr:protein suppressor of hairy wing-like isoform X2 [Leptopilina boulardi]
MNQSIDAVKVEEILSKTSCLIKDDTLTSCETVSESLIIPDTLDTVEVNKDGYFTHNGHLIEIVMDYECVTCHRIFQNKDLLTEHLEVCREEDDDTNLLDLGNLDEYYETDDEEGDDADDVDDPKYSLSDEKSSDSDRLKNNNEKPDIKPVSENQCHCCGEDLKNAHRGGPHKCSECDLSFKKASSLQRHTIIIHWENENHTCNICDASFRDKKSLDKHKYTTHSTNKVYKCERCDKYFSRSYHLNRHKLQSGCHGELQTTFSCQVCNKEFTRKDNLREHLRSHAGNQKRQKKQCSQCPKEFYTTQQLIIHERMHTGEKPINCDLCDKSFNSTLAMKKHRRVHTGEKPYECKFCKKRFAARETLNRHQRIHTGEKPHVCQYCKKSFIQAAQLRAHIFHHTGENGFTCEDCGKTFNRKARLTVHRKFVHEGVTPFMCDVCKRPFTRKEDLAKHTLLHTGLKPHKCTKCEKSFATKSSLQAHLNTHRREPPQSCAECGRAFIRQDCLMRHIRAKHRDLLEDIMGEAEKRHLQLQLFNIATTAAEKHKKGSSSTLSADQLLKAIVELLTILIEEETLQVFGWPTEPVQDILEAVIRRCGHVPITGDSDIPFEERLRENVKLLFTVVIEDQNVKKLLTIQTVDEVILHVLKLSNDLAKSTEQSFESL